MFYGQSEHNIDSKGRLFMPNKFKGMLSGGLTVSFGVDKVLNIMTASDWEEYENKVSEELQLTRDREAYRRLFGFSLKTAMDAQGRILLPDTFLKYAGLTDKVVMVGCGKRIEVWAADKWKEYTDTLDFGDVAATLESYGL